jgi:uncharacterized protein Yka (UPF0111/DUF47 family)
MPDEMGQLLRRMDMTERNQTDLAKSVTELTEEIGELQKPLRQLETDREVRKERDKHLNERLDRIEVSIDRIYRLGWWVLAAFGASAVALVANFAFRGGFVVN